MVRVEGPGGSERTRQREVHWVVRGGAVRTADGATHPIDVDPVVVGRDAGAQIVLADPEVSAAHLELRAVTEGILVRDLGSTNGTFVGPLRVHEAVVRTATAVTLGHTTLTVEPSGERRVDVGWSDGFGPLVGRSPRMRRVFGVLERIAPTPLSVLILGETGTGKEMVAKAIHEASPRKDRPFVVVDCGSIPPTLAESILFGHEKGAFTGADQRRKGALADADGGTLFLDELGELPLDLQPKLLRALSERQVKRVGGSAFEPIDVRVLAATRRDISAEMNAGRFRSDLYFRIAQVRVELPPLRERPGDIAQLVESVCKRAGKAEHAAAVVGWIQQNLALHDWPGNVRELVNVASVAAMLADTPGAIDDVLALTRVDSAGDGDASGRAPITAFAEAKRQALIDFERSYFTALNQSASGNVSEMARQSGMERHHVRAYLRKHKISG
ncbi:MAG TPA: sigma 54-dependent Fis family transcriptional regulator [Polyangiaceae bacterium]|nr:sigma 54-dependent Fis family transcriptional regulator [Polyangiaceae bacterium]